MWGEWIGMVFAVLGAGGVEEQENNADRKIEIIRLVAQYQTSCANMFEET